jgi:SAM-dependent methyltransferase
MKMNQTPSLHSRHLFLEWYHVTTVGQILQTIEASYLQSALKLTYNQKTLQVGPLGSETIYIDEAFAADFALIDPHAEGPARLAGIIRAVPEELPIANGSIDVLILPHVLEFEVNKHQVLREVERVLKPEGKLFILGFNPWSIHGVLQYLPRKSSFWRADFVSSHRLLDWLSLLKFDTEFHAAFSVTSSQVIRQPDGFLGKSRAYLSFAYAVRAIKRRYTLVPIEPAWITAPSLAAGHMFGTSKPL